MRADNSGGVIPGGAKPLCEATTKDGRPCPVHAVHGSDPPRCCFHSDLHQAASSKGGRHKEQRRRLLAGEVDLSDPSTVRAFHESLVRAVLTNVVSAPLAKAASEIAEAALRVRAGAELEDRLDALDAALAALVARREVE